jgi:hypothetical protein
VVVVGNSDTYERWGRITVDRHGLSRVAAR